MPKYRITFTNSLTDKSWHTDIQAKNSDEAFQQTYAMPQAKSGEYTGVSVELITEGPKNIGIRFRYHDDVFKEDFTDYLIIHAEDEAQAKEYYNEHYKGKRFSIYAGDIEPGGKCTYGRILDTCFAACPGYHADATIS